MSRFWDKFAALMDELPKEIDRHMSKSSITIKKRTVNGKVVEDVVIVDGKEYVPKGGTPDGQ